MTTVLVLLGTACGLGIVTIVAGLLHRPSLAAELRAYRTAATGTVAPPRMPGALREMGSTLDRLLGGAERTSQQAQDLAITGGTLERHGLLTAVGVLVGFSVPLAGGAALAAVGWELPDEGVLVLAGLGAVAGCIGPSLALRRAAAKERERFLRGLSCWLELVALAQAGGMGFESALEAAGRVSHDPAFVRIRHALERARHSGASPWEEMARLGAELGIDELDELAASLGLAGLEGARIRSSLTAKSESLRRRQMSEAEAKANATTERLFLPSIVMMVGFLVFIMFPAGVSLARVL